MMRSRLLLLRTGIWQRGGYWIRTSHVSQQRRSLQWVPIAYRGSPRQQGDHHDAPPHTYPKTSSFPSTRSTSPSKSPAAAQEHSKHSELISIHHSLLRLVRDYRGHFSSEHLFDTSSSSRGAAVRVTYQDKTQQLKAVIRQMMQQIRFLFDDIHKADDIVEWSRIIETEESFRGVCRALQDIVRTSVELSHMQDDNDVGQAYLDLAEFALSTLARSVSDRALLVESTKTWSSKMRLSSSNSNTVMGRLSSLFVEEREEQLPTSPMPLAHEDESLGATQRLFRSVLTRIVSIIEDQVQAAKEQSQDGKLAPEDRKQIESTSRRLTALLDAMPSTWVPDTANMGKVLEILSRVGNLDSARACHFAFNRHPSNQYRLRLSLVLQAYLEAIKNEEEEDNVLSAVQEVLQLFHTAWDENYPGHQETRIVHSGIVLNCICVAQRSFSIPDVCDAADLVVKRTLGNTVYKMLYDEINSKKPNVDHQSMRLVHCLSFIYVLSEEEQRQEEAKLLFRYIMQSNKDGVGNFGVYPVVDTFNAILKRTTEKYEGRAPPSEKRAKLARAREWQMMRGFLDNLLSRNEVGCWPNADSFVLLFRVLLALNPKNIGEQADHLVSAMFIRLSYSRNQEGDDFFIPLSIYHRALRCWLEAAKNPATKDAASRALHVFNQLQVQSTPLLLNERETRIESVSRLYDTTLRPSRKTCHLVHQICVETRNPSDFETALDVALEIYDRMVKNGPSPDKGTLDAVQKCIVRLPGDSDKRKTAEQLLQSREAVHLEYNEGDDVEVG